MAQHLIPVVAEPMTFRAAPPAIAILSRQGRAGLADHGLDALEAATSVTFTTATGSVPGDVACRALAGAQIAAVTPLVSPVWTHDLLDHLPSLELLALHATGYDFIDLELLVGHGVRLSILPDYSTVSVAEHTMALLLAISRRVHLANDRSRNLVPQEVSLRGFELAGRTIGIIGLGRIGTAVARMAQAFGMHVVGNDEADRAVEGVERVTFGSLLDRADVVAVTASMDHDAKPLLGRDELARLRDGAVIVNTSRSGLVDNDAVAAALRSRRLRGYGVDDTVFDPDDHADLLAEGRVVQTGHCAWWADEALDRGSQRWMATLLAAVEGRPIPLVQPAT